MPIRRRLTLVLALLGLCAACGEDRKQPAPVPVPLPAPETATAPAATPAPAAAAPAAVPEVDRARPGVLSDRWYRRLEDGQQIGWLHVVWTATVFDAEPAVHDRTETHSASTRDMGGSTDTFESHVVLDLDRTPGGGILRLVTTTFEATRRTIEDMRWTGSGYELVSRVGKLEERRAIACDAPVPTDPEAFLSERAANGSLAVGQEYRYPTLNWTGRRLDTVVLRIEGEEVLDLEDGPANCWRLGESVEGRPGTSTWWIDKAGVLRKQRSGGSEIHSVPERVARALAPGGAVHSITIRAEPFLPRCTSFDRSVVDVVLAPREGVELPDFPTTPFSREISRDGNRIRVELLAHDPPTEPVTPPFTDPALARWLERTPLFAADDPRVKAALRRAVGDATDGREMVRRILRYVFASLQKASGPIAQPTAVEILEAGCGDCSEHCVLFVTLCRAAGIPARRLSGYAQVGDMWGSHSFAEVWLGRWVGADPTTNDLGTRARYLCFGWDDDADSFPDVVSSRIRGRMRIQTVEFDDAGRTYRVDELSASATEDPRSGLAFASAPEGWTAQTRGVVGRGRITGPGITCDVDVQSGAGDLPAELLSGWMLRGSEPFQFAGIEAVRLDHMVRGRQALWILIPYARRTLSLQIQTRDRASADAALPVIEKLLEPTLRPRAPDAHER